MANALTDERQRTLVALCDTFAPSVEVDTHDQVEKQFMARSASDMGLPAEIEGMLAETMTGEEFGAVGGLLDALAGHEFADLSLEARTQAVHDVSASDAAACQGLAALRGLTLLLFYGLPDETGGNPNWDAIGYPGPPAAPPSPEQAPKTIVVEAVDGPSATLTADVCVVGSGAGGSVIAARLAAAGRSVVVLEMGQYRNESDFKGLELVGYQELYYGGGLATSEDGSISILAGSTLGGGTVVNYMNCIRTPDHIRSEWAEHGLLGLEDESYTERIDTVMERLNANTEATKQNQIHRHLMAGLDAQGYEHRPIVRNASLDDDAEFCGYCAAGCPRGCKRSAMKTWLQDASDSGARAVVGTHADRIITADGAAAGVEATVTHADGSTTALTVEAPTVVVACGSIESPALLLRSGIGGPAVGKNLRLHQAFSVVGTYDEPVDGFRGQVQSLVSDVFCGLEDNHGFLIEATGMYPAFFSPGIPWENGGQHKQAMLGYRFQAPFITVGRDHGAGEVVLDDLGRAVVRWGLGDEVDMRMAVRAHLELCKLHEAAGAAEIFTLHSKRLGWRRGEGFAEFLKRVESAPYGPQDLTIFTAHQMGACRMGSDPQTSVADGRGELHDVSGVWIGDASAFPTAPGVNPMISIMSLAHRTADMIATGSGVSAG